MTPARANALLCGDLSGAIIHPIFIALATLIGFMYWQDAIGQYDIAQEDDFLREVDTAMELMRAEEGLVTDIKLATVMQAHALLAFYSFWRQQLRRGLDNLFSAIGIAKRFDFVEIVGNQLPIISGDHRALGAVSIEARHDQEELISAFCQLIYIDCSVQVVQGIEPFFADARVDTLYQLKV